MTVMVGMVMVVTRGRRAIVMAVVVGVAVSGTMSVIGAVEGRVRVRWGVGGGLVGQIAVAAGDAGEIAGSVGVTGTSGGMRSALGRTGMEKDGAHTTLPVFKKTFADFLDCGTDAIS